MDLLQYNVNMCCKYSIGVCKLVLRIGVVCFVQSVVGYVFRLHESHVRINNKEIENIIQI